jgi:hypothetical protein
MTCCDNAINSLVSLHSGVEELGAGNWAQINTFRAEVRSISRIAVGLTSTTYQAQYNMFYMYMRVVSKLVCAASDRLCFHPMQKRPSRVGANDCESALIKDVLPLT